MRLLHALATTVASFDDPHLVSHAGLVPVMALAERAGLGELAAEHVRPAGDCGVNARLKVPALVAGMAAGADSIDDMDVLRHGAMGILFGGVRAPSTLGSHLRSYTWGNVSQLEQPGRGFLAGLARRAPLLPGARTLAFVDIDSMQKRVYGHAKQGAKFGHTKIAGKSLLVRGLNALAAVISTPIAAPVIAATRLRGGNAASARGAASLAVQAIGTGPSRPGAERPFHGLQPGYQRQVRSASRAARTHAPSPAIPAGPEQPRPPRHGAAATRASRQPAAPRQFSGKRDRPGEKAKLSQLRFIIAPHPDRSGGQPTGRPSRTSTS
ncbi:hypothetical protein EAS64_29090 [Trebonia kvetii]|uniref:IS1380 family transposase n=1 Tax=Trebonia kvetii TaxID=2480626 RepID=A0A6P2BWI0_9ACTN|nr:hypothetical protein [Trebonia kvetii]TVZ01553.1 hypothetical protein EAS64_29090 [Trebonia kvetii]